MKANHETPMEELIAGWIREALYEGASKVDTTVRKMASAEAQGIWGRVRALEGAMLRAKAGHPVAPQAVATLCNRIQLIASVYDLAEVRTAAAAIGRTVSGTTLGSSVEADLALYLLVDMANKAVPSTGQAERSAA